MHIAIAVFVIVLVWKKGVWRDWEKYHSTMLFFGFMELIYNMITEPNNYFLWKLVPDMGLSRVMVVSLYVFIIFPGTVMLYLSKYPKEIKKQAAYICKWVAIYGIIEWIGSLANVIAYIHKWNIYSSIIFDLIMFLGLRLHYKRPFTAYIVFITVTILGIIFYGIPISGQ